MDMFDKTSVAITFADNMKDNIFNISSNIIDVSSMMFFYGDSDFYQ